jgi:glycosyltransferase involved in cell wall biosynthesis
MNAKSCTCIIPFYNEQDWVVDVLSKMANNSCFDRILLVNDWSTDKSLFLVEQFLSTKKDDRIQLVSYLHNRGKSYAIQQGLQKLDTEYVFLFDSDLKNIDIKEIIYAIEHMYQHPEIDMGILRRVYAKRYIKLFYRELILSGQRMLRTSDLKKVFCSKIWKISIRSCYQYVYARS